MSSHEYIATTVIEFEDGELQGQVLRRGTKTDCEQTMQLISAISYSGDRVIVSSNIRVIEAVDCFNMQVGQQWRAKCPDAKNL